jgi:hypothetical protein
VGQVVKNEMAGQLRKLKWESRGVKQDQRLSAHYQHELNRMATNM